MLDFIPIQLRLAWGCMFAFVNTAMVFVDAADMELIFPQNYFAG